MWYFQARKFSYYPSNPLFSDNQLVCKRSQALGMEGYSLSSQMKETQYIKVSRLIIYLIFNFFLNTFRECVVKVVLGNGVLVLSTVLG